jgi:predicted RNase H-like HicB family nuclease
MGDDTTAVHAVTETGEHIVGIGDLHVLLVEEENCWYAQGLEIDYVAQGDSIEEAKANFEVGFHTTIRENLKIHGTIEPLLEPAPQEVWKDRLSPSSKAKRFFYLSIHNARELDDIRDFLPFQAIEYLQNV